MASSTDAVRADIERVLQGPLRELELDLEAVELTPAGRRRILRIAVDGEDGVTLDAVAEATRAVSQTLDESEVMGEQPYTLEVTSRGVDRPLTLPRHWRRNAGRLVKVTGHDGSVVVGRIAGSTEDAATLEVDAGVDAGSREVAFADVATALVQVEFNRKDPATDEEG